MEHEQEDGSGAAGPHVVVEPPADAPIDTSSEDGTHTDSDAEAMAQLPSPENEKEMSLHTGSSDDDDDDGGDEKKAVKEEDEDGEAIELSTIDGLKVVPEAIEVQEDSIQEHVCIGVEHVTVAVAPLFDDSGRLSGFGDDSNGSGGFDNGDYHRRGGSLGSMSMASDLSFMSMDDDVFEGFHASEVLDDIPAIEGSDEPVDVRVVYNWSRDVKKHKKANKQNADQRVKRWLTQNLRQERRRRRRKKDKDEAADLERRRTHRARSTLSEKAAPEVGKTASFRCVSRVVHNGLFTTTMTVLTVWALFGTDVQRAFIPKEYDDLLAAVMLGVLVAFIGELFALSYVHPRSYRGGFFFWADIVAAVSLIPDVLPLFGVETTGLDSLTLARAGRAARAAARTARFIRVMKLFQISDRRAAVRKDRGEAIDFLDADGKTGSDADSDSEASVVGRTPSVVENERAQQAVQLKRTRSVAAVYDEKAHERSVVGDRADAVVFQHVFFGILVTFLLSALVQPLTNEGMHAEAAINQLANATDVTSALSVFDASYGGDLLFARVGSTVVVNKVGRLDDLRDSEVFEVTTSCCAASFDIRDERRLEAILSAVTILCLIILLLVVSGTASRRLRHILVTPVEQMVSMVKALALNPLVTLTIPDDFSYETGLVRSMFAKVAVLMQVALGATGSSIISHNMSHSSGLVPLVKGRRQDAVFLECSVRHFGVITDELQEKISILLNLTAELIHGIAGSLHGVPVSNTGQTFLFAFPLPPRRYTDRGTFEQRKLLLCESSFSAAIEMQRVVGESEEIQDMLRAVPECSKLSFDIGIHLGWAVAGAIGSVLKVDATYVSSHVHVTSMLARAAPIYGVDALASEAVVEALPDDQRRRCLLVDRVRLRGREPIRIYAVDYPKLPPPKEGDAADKKNGGDWSMAGLVGKREWERSLFVDAYEAAVHAYLAGAWPEAKEKFEDAHRMLEELVGAADMNYRICSVVPQFIDYSMGGSPQKWRGFRDLDV